MSNTIGQMTERLLVDAGIGAGMRVLDIAYIGDMVFGAWARKPG